MGQTFRFRDWNKQMLVHFWWLNNVIWRYLIWPTHFIVTQWTSPIWIMFRGIFQYFSLAISWFNKPVAKKHGWWSTHGTIMEPWLYVTKHNISGLKKNCVSSKSSIYIGFSIRNHFIRNHPFWGTPIWGNPHILKSALDVPPVSANSPPKWFFSITSCSWSFSWTFATVWIWWFHGDLINQYEKLTHKYGDTTGV